MMSQAEGTKLLRALNRVLNHLEEWLIATMIAAGVPVTSIVSTLSEEWELSAHRVRELLRAGTLPPPEFTRPEVARVLIDALRVA